jgi:hypothetical protein
LKGISRTGEVRRNNLPDNAKWLTARVCEVAFLRLDDLPVDLVRPTSVIPERADRQPEVHSFSAGEGLASVESLDRSQFIEVLFHEVGKLVEELATFFTGNLEAPSIFEGLLGADDGFVNVLGCPLINGSEDLSVAYLDPVRSHYLTDGIANSLGSITLRKNDISNANSLGAAAERRLTRLWCLRIQH